MRVDKQTEESIYGAEVISWLNLRKSATIMMTDLLSNFSGKNGKQQLLKSDSELIIFVF